MSKFSISHSLLIKVTVTLTVLFIFFIAYLDAWVQEKLDEKLYSDPSIVYARPLELYNSKVVNLTTVVEQLKLAGFEASSQSLPMSYEIREHELSYVIPDFFWWDGFKPKHTVRVQLFVIWRVRLA